MKKLIFLLLFCFSLPVAAAELATPTAALDGVEMSYEYTSGRAYHLKFADGAVSYRYLTGAKPEKWWGPFAYTAFNVDNDEYMLSWFEEAYGDYVTLLVNFDTRLVYGSAILQGKTVHFHGAHLKTSTYSAD